MARALTVALVLGLFAGCTSQSSTLTPVPSAALSIPAYQYPADIQCLIDHGWRVVEVEPPQFEGDPPSYQLEIGVDVYSDQERTNIIDLCDALVPPRPEKTDAEIGVIYERWLEERDCLIGLGYTPVEPPSFETFLADWKSESAAESPWTPLDGVDTNAWNAAQYAGAKARCTLEFFDRD